MRRILLLTITILLSITVPLSPPAETQQPEQELGGDKLPNPEDYSAGENCKRKSKLAPNVTMPAEPGTASQYRCVLSFYNCETDKTEIYRSDPHGPRARCAKYQELKGALIHREVCCEKEELPCTPPEPTSSGPNWFDTTYRCKDLKETNLTNTVVGGKCQLKYSVCGAVVFTILSAQRLNAADCTRWADNYESKFPPRVCCDRWRQAAVADSPCNPLRDADCDGKLNAQDDFVDVPETYETAPGAPIDAPPRGLNLDEISPTEPCEDCKWVLTRGELKCNSSATEHTYLATWKCPKTGAEQITVKTAPATAPCSK
jgi:hypothetical protein